MAKSKGILGRRVNNWLKKINKKLKDIDKSHWNLKYIENRILVTLTDNHQTKAIKEFFS